MRKTIPAICLALLGLSAKGVGLAADTAGIGIAWGKDGDNIVVKLVMPNYAAAQSKAVKVGDRVVGIGQEIGGSVDVRGMPLERVVQLIRGQVGTLVRLTVVPAGMGEDDARSISLIRGEIKELEGYGTVLANGTKAPNIHFVGLSDGRAPRGQLSDFRGIVVLVEFWATWCAPCIQRLDRLQQLRQKRPEWKDRVELLAVSIDDRGEDARALIGRKRWNETRNVWASDPDIRKRYGITGIPSFFLIDQHGTIVASGFLTDDEISSAVNRLIAR